MSVRVIIPIIVLLIIIISFKGNKVIRSENTIMNANNSLKGNDDETKIIGEIHPIDTSKYKKYIFVHNSTEEYIVEHLKSYGEILAGNKQKYDLKYFNLNDNWILIKCPKDFNFYHYHNLTCWLLGTDENHRPDMTVAIASHNDNIYESYYATLDTNSYGDTFVGVFNDGKKFSIYLPDSYEDQGNILIGDNYLSIVGIKEYMIQKMNIDFDKVQSIDENNYKIESVEI